MPTLRKSLVLACAVSVLSFGAAMAQENTNSNPNNPSQSPGGMVKSVDPAMQPMAPQPMAAKPMMKKHKKHMKKMNKM